MRRLFSFMIAAHLVLAALAMGGAKRPEAQLVNDQAAIRQDKKELQTDRHAVTDDRMDLDRLSDLVMRWDRLRKSNASSSAIEAVEAQIMRELRRDLAENTVQAGKAEEEAERSGKELRKSGREVRKERRDGDHRPGELRDDRRDRRDDRKDLADDIRDSKEAKELLAKKEATAAELLALQRRIDLAGGRLDEVLRREQSTLLERYLELSEEEIRMGLRELREDHEELKEDRQEKAEDRREKRRDRH